MYKLIMKNEYATFEQLFVSEIDLTPLKIDSKQSKNNTQ